MGVQELCYQAEGKHTKRITFNLLFAQSTVATKIEKFYDRFVKLLGKDDSKKNDNWISNWQEPFLADCAATFEIHAKRKLGPWSKKKVKFHHNYTLIKNKQYHERQNYHHYHWYHHQHDHKCNHEHHDN